MCCQSSVLNTSEWMESMREVSLYIFDRLSINWTSKNNQPSQSNYNS